MNRPRRWQRLALTLLMAAVALVAFSAESCFESPTVPAQDCSRFDYWTVSGEGCISVTHEWSAIYEECRPTHRVIKCP